MKSVRINKPVIYKVRHPITILLAAGVLVRACLNKKYEKKYIKVKDMAIAKQIRKGVRPFSLHSLNKPFVEIVLSSPTLLSPLEIMS